MPLIATASVQHDNLVANALHIASDIVEGADLPADTSAVLDEGSGANEGEFTHVDSEVLRHATSKMEPVRRDVASREIQIVRQNKMTGIALIADRQKRPNSSTPTQPILSSGC
jgi:hypothetical protein